MVLKSFLNVYSEVRMKVVHIESGLGNQMLSYAEYLVIKKLNPNDECYIETMIYDIPECNEVICQWNGYELERIFGIHAPNIRDKFDEVQWTNIMDDLRKSEFWKHDWNYAPVITEALNRQGLNLINYRGEAVEYIPKRHIWSDLMDSRIGYDIKRWTRPLYQDSYRKKMDCSSKIFIQTDEDVFTGQQLGLRNYGANIDFVKAEILQAFQFPELKEKNNLEILNKIQNCNSVAIHARRGDMLQSNGYCYKYGYFKRATKYIRKHVENPVFFFFCDTESIDWCKANEKIFGLNFKKDTVYFVDWNRGKDSYIDMQLMGKCKHNIITNSSFGWWGAYFNQNPDKITCSPNVWINTTVSL